MFTSCDIPSSFILESLSGVSQSFGSQTNADGARNLWFHFLGKHVERQEENGQVRIVHAGQYMSQDNPIWTKTGVVLRVKRPETSSSSISASTDCSAHLEIYFFGAPPTFVERLQHIKEQASCKEMLEDPYMLVGVLIEEMHKLLDEAGWGVAHSFRPIETNTLKGAEEDTFMNGKEVKFGGLHNLAKHAIFLQENCDSALATLECFRAFHESTIDKSPNHSQLALKENLAYQKTLFESTKRRLASLDRRMNNIIQLSFHLVTQSDSRTMQSESKSMKTIAVMTLFFMPLGTVAAVFGTEFVYITGDGPFSIDVTGDFWILWLVAGPLTLLVYLTWRFWYWDTRASLIGKMPGLGGRHLYDGIKRVDRYFERRLRQRKQAGKTADQGVELSDMS
ncbi:hypothetical protein N0V90_012269 [Kalmusia sp. IMI 367209]|nr:hypothetical protein N0V90_012269 [Kalmusia sp. IMI 367209]